MLALLAQIAGGYSLIQIAIFVVVILGVVGIVLVVAKQMGVAIPPFIITIFWIVLAVVIGIVAIKFIASLL